MPRMIETKRLILRPFFPDDAEDVYGYLKDPATDCFADMKMHSLEEAKAEMEKRQSDKEYYLAIVMKETGRVIGEIFGRPEGAFPGDQAADTFSPCWMLDPAYGGKGYAIEAVSAYFDWLFGEKGIRRIYAFTADTNARSRRLCERLGMRQEGMFLEHVSFISGPDGKPVYENTAQYAILKREWEEKRGQPDR
ncbi:MAG: GNAT family N-acetyltransferase [Clostridia bacterium]|nr:GNAT family N-acetyltransferase [Clostridia bacterium]